MITRLAAKSDIHTIILIQEMNLFENLSRLEREQNGFVTTPFTISQLKRLIAGRGLFVVESDDQVHGYTAAAGWEYFSQWPINPFMITRLAGTRFRDVIISEHNSFQYGPVCIDENLRGTQAFPRLFEEMRLEMCPRFPVGITFINKANQRSYRAHTRRLGMTVVDEFQYGEREYYCLAFDTAVSVLQ